MDRLTIEDVERLISVSAMVTSVSDWKELPVRASEVLQVAKQLADTMRENERLRGLLKRVTEDTEYSCMLPDIQDAIEQALSSKDSVK